MLYYDEAQVDKHFYVALDENCDKLADLSLKLQEESSNSAKFTYITRTAELKANDKLEALFDQDKQWYRICVKQVSSSQVTVYYADFGNCQTIDADTLKQTRPLRVRNYFDNDREAELYELNYQAVKCVYTDESGDVDLGIGQFLGHVTELDDFENGFYIRVSKCVANNFDADRFELTSLTYGVQLINNASANATEAAVAAKQAANRQEEQHCEIDREVSSILECSQLSEEVYLPALRPVAPLKKNETYTVSVVHVASVSEFYVQLNKDIEDLLRLQELIHVLMERVLSEEKKVIEVSKKEPMHKVGDLVFAKFDQDMCWYRGLVLESKLVRILFALVEVN